VLDLVQGLASLPAAPRIIIAAPRGLASTLAAAGKHGAFATLSLPLRRHRLWHTLAAALGRASLGQRQGVGGSGTIGWQPPALEAAKDSRALVLVAEDNLTNQVVIRRLLSQRGYAHEIAGNGVAALRLYEQNPDAYGMLLTDFHMPEMDGFALAREVRRHEAGSDRRLPIVALTADALPGTEQRCLEAGMDGYLTKPIDSKALTATLEKFVPQALALRQRAGAAPTPAPPRSAPSIDPEILDLAHLSEMFGGINDDARDFLLDFVGDVPRMISEINDGLVAGDGPQAREATHALKGAARSAGAGRLGQIASELQDRLDDSDLDKARLLYQKLLPSHGELHAAFQELRAAAA
jgi:two-component system sensor histidine kinase/response regulator